MKTLTLLAFAFLLAATSTHAQRGSRRAPVENNVQFDKSPPDVPLTDPDPQFPVRIHLVSARWGGDRSTYGGYGSGNILDAAAPQGFDFSFICSEPFDSNDEPARFYTARWVKPALRLQIRMHPAGGTRVDTCDLDIALKARAFTPDDARFLRTSATVHVTPHWTPADVAAPNAPPDFPLQLHVLSASRIDGLHIVRGHAIATLAADPASRLHFAYECDPGFVANSQPEDFYPARWTRPNERLEILTRRTGSEHLDRCELQLSAAQPGN